MGIGTIRIKMFDGIVRTLTNFRHLLELKKNLISSSMLDSIGCKGALAEGGALRVCKGALVVMKRKKTNGLYILQGSMVTGVAAVSSMSNFASQDYGICS